MENNERELLIKKIMFRVELLQNLPVEKLRIVNGFLKGVLGR